MHNTLPSKPAHKAKIVSRNGEYIALNLENLNLFRVDEGEAAILSLFDKGLTPAQIAAQLQVPRETCEETLRVFSTLPRGISLSEEEVGVFDELLLMVATDCNMACRYCYGGGGTYKRERALMDTETAFKAVDAALSLGDMKMITFFGGEPLLNFQLIKEVVERVEPEITCGIITNGTIMTEEIATFIKEHHLPITVSIDGPQEVHDAGRVYPGGKGTHQKVVETIHMLEKEGVPFAVEATFTRKALEKGYTARDILEYVYQFTPTINIAPVAVVDDPLFRLSPQELKEFKIGCIDFVFDKIIKGEPINVLNITALICNIASPERMIPRTFCPYHAKRFAVFPNGDAFPCYLVMDEKYKYGNVFDTKFVERFEEKSRKILPLLCRDRLKESPWFLPLMTHICVSTLTEEGEYCTLDEAGLSTGAEVTEHLLYRMSQIRGWHTFFEMLQRMGM